MKKLIFSGPYGNLTSLYSGALAAHPKVVGLNHGRQDIPDDCAFYETRNQSEAMDKLESFVQYVLQRKDEWSNHALEKGYLDDLSSVAEYESDSPEMIFWKESGFFTGWIRNSATAEKMLEADKDLVLIRPVRNPIDCMVTNIQNYHYFNYDDMKKNSQESLKERWESYFPFGQNRSHEMMAQNKAYGFLSEWWLSDYAWHAQLRDKYPEQVLFLMPEEKLSSMFDRLGLDCTGDFRKAVDRCGEGIIKKQVHELFEENLKSSLSDAIFKSSDLPGQDMMKLFKLLNT